MSPGRSGGPYAAEASHYETLGLTPTATHEEVRAAYLARALRHHPDRQAPVDRALAERRMQEVNGAWAVLGDRDARAAYDADLGLVDDDGEPADVVGVESRRPVGPANLRRFVPLVVGLGLIVLFLVFTAYAGSPRS
jgi:curved DNA-binding protein CbpA